MDAKQRAFIENKLKGMDEQYFTNVSMHLSHVSNSKDDIFREYKEVFNRYFVTCFEIAEAKYIGYWKLIEDAAAVEDEIAIETEFKGKIRALEQQRRLYAEKIDSLHEKLIDLTKQPFPLDNYDSVYFNDGRMYPREDGVLCPAS